MNAEQQQYLQSQGYPSGMARALHAQKQFFPVSFWILDNGSAMLVADAHLLRGQYQDVQGATRWEELRDCVAYHADLSARFGFPTRYALLNQPSSSTNMTLPQYFSIHQSAGNLAHEQQVLRQVMTTAVPAGPTPLTAQLRILREHLVSLAPQLRARNQRAPIVICTQGLPTTSNDNQPAVPEFIQTLQSLEQLPVSIVLRICSDDEKAFEFYNGLDAHIQLPMDVL